MIRVMGLFLLNESASAISISEGIKSLRPDNFLSAGSATA